MSSRAGSINHENVEIEVERYLRTMRAQLSVIHVPTGTDVCQRVDIRDLQVEGVEDAIVNRLIYKLAKKISHQDQLAQRNMESFAGSQEDEQQVKVVQALG